MLEGLIERMELLWDSGKDVRFLVMQPLGIVRERVRARTGRLGGGWWEGDEKVMGAT